MKTNDCKTTSSRIAGFALACALMSAPVWSQEKPALLLEGSQPTRYIVTDLGPIGQNPGQPFVVSGDGFVSGVVVVPGGSGSVAHAVIWKRGAMTDLSSHGLGGPNSTAFGVNIWGQAVGQADTSTPDPQGEDFCGSTALGLTHSGNTCLPYLFQNGVMTPLPTLRNSNGMSGNNGEALQINTFGVAVGSSENTMKDTSCPGVTVSPQYYEFKPVIWYSPWLGSAPVAHELPTVSPDPDGIAVAVNEEGDAAGASGGCSAFNIIELNNLVSRHAILWHNGKAIDLGNLGGDGSFNGIYAAGLNNRGQVVGASDTTGDASFHAFLWQNGSMTDLGTYPGDSYSLATAINDQGKVTGVSLDANFNIRAVLWENGKPIDLNTLVPSDTTLDLQTACSITFEGQIIGIAAVKGTSDFHGYLLTPRFRELDREESAAEPETARETGARAQGQGRSLEGQRF